MAKLARKLKKGEIKLSKESKERMKKVVDFTPMTEQTMEDLINEWNDYIDKNMKFYPWWLDEKKRKPVCLDSLFGSEIEYKLNRAEQMADEYKRFNRLHRIVQRIQFRRWRRLAIKSKKILKNIMIGRVRIQKISRRKNKKKFNFFFCKDLINSSNIK